MNTQTPTVTLVSVGKNDSGFIGHHVATYYIDGVKHERVSFNHDESGNGFYWAELMKKSIENILLTFSHDSSLISPEDAIDESIALCLGSTGVEYVKAAN